MDVLEKSIKDICNNYCRYILNLRNVNGIGYGFKYINNLNTFKPCINVLVEKKLPLNYISKDNLIPKSYMGIMTDVIEVGQPKIRRKISLPIKRKSRPLESGVSISSTKYSGTLGCIVTKQISPKVKEYFILSNAHVLVYEDTNSIPIGSSVFQPSKELIDSEKPKKNLIANLTDFKRLDFMTIDNIEKLPENDIDCAIAKIIKKVSVSKKIYGLGKIKGIGTSTLNQKVRKVAAFSGLTEGYITTLYTSAFLGFDKTTTVYYQDLIVSDLPNKPGDSGSIIVNELNEVLGLFVGGSDYKAYMCDINKTLKYFNVSLYTD